jgi:hypothetical protein
MCSLPIKLVTIVAATHGFRMLGMWLGPRWSGLMLGLPCSTAIALYFFAHEQGLDFANQAAQTALLGLVGAVGLSVTYALLTARGHSFAHSLSAAIASYFVLAWAVKPASALGVLFAMLLTSAAVAAGSLVTQRIAVPAEDESRPCRELGFARRFVVRTIPSACLVVILELAPRIGESWAGLLGTFPSMFLAVLVVTYLEAGRVVALQTARAFPLGNLSMIAFVGVFWALGGSAGGLLGQFAFGYLASALTLLAAARLRSAMATRRCTSRAAGRNTSTPRVFSRAAQGLRQEA